EISWGVWNTPESEVNVLPDVRGGVGSHGALPPRRHRRPRGAGVPRDVKWDRTAHFPRDVIDALGELGFLGMCAPEEYEGMGLDTVTYLLALEEIAAADASIAVSLSIHNAIPTTMLVRHGTPAQKDRFLKGMARGELLAGFALSEPESG